MIRISAEAALTSRWVDLIDIRTPEERQILGFIPGSLRIEVDRLDGALRSTFISKTVALVCNSGRRAKEVIGASNVPEGMVVGYLDGGVLAWREAGFPYVSGDAPASMPEAYREADISSPEEFLDLLRSCFVAELIEAHMTQEDAQDIDPVVMFESAVTQARLAHDGVDDSLEEVIDQLAAANRRLGGSLIRIAENTSLMRAVLEDTLLQSA